MSRAAQETNQIKEWKGSFGREYSDRNTLDGAGLDALYSKNYGVTRTELNREFLAEVPTDSAILEVGCNVGNQLLLLQQMGFKNLYGIEVQTYAVDHARRRVPGANVQEGSAFDIPFSDQQFDLVFTSGVLIHLAPGDLLQALGEIHRTARTWIWGMEYYAPSAAEVPYRGHAGLLWKNDYARLYLNEFADLEVAKERRLPYLENPNVDSMFLLRRKG